MYNFEFYNPVRVLFGKGKIAEITKYLPKEGKILLTYGGGSIKRNGVYDQVIEALSGFDYLEFPGIEVNPKYEQLIPAVDLVQKQAVTFILAVGGGSVIDGSKFIAAAAKYQNGDPWELLSKEAPVKKAIPLGVVLTLPATGTEMNGNSVISRISSQEKFAFSSSKVLPVFSVLDPLTTFSLPKNQVVNGVVDAYIHVIEQYLTYSVNSPVQDRYAESLLKILLEEGAKAYELEEPDYENRANIMWAATNALNHFLSMGVKSDWATHMIGHELTALHGLDHAVTLAIVLPGVMEFSKVARKERLLQYAERIWGLSGFDYQAIIDEATRSTEQFFNCLGVKTRLSDYEIGHDTINQIVERISSRNMTYINRCNDITPTNVRSILESRL